MLSPVSYTNHRKRPFQEYEQTASNSLLADKLKDAAFPVITGQNSQSGYRASKSQRVPKLAPKKLFEDDSSDLFTLYKLDRHKHNQSQIYEQLLLIEETMQYDFEMIEYAREQIISILHHSSMTEEQKIGELGALYYLIQKNKIFPSGSSYIELLSKEIEQGARVLDGEATQKISFLLEEFSQIILTTEQKLNIGGVYAVIQLIERPKAPCFFLEYEHREHILKVLGHLLSDTRLKKIFEEKICIDPSLEAFVQFDQQHCEEMQITSLDTIRACLVALMFDIRQEMLPNCYAITSLIYIVQNDPFILVTLLLGWLREGRINLSSTVSCPIFPLVKRRWDLLPRNQEKNALITLCLTIFEVKIANCGLERPKANFAQKKVFIEALIHFVEPNLTREVLERLQEELHQHFWIENCGQLEISHDGKQMAYGPTGSRKMLECSNDIAVALANYLTDACTIFYLDQDYCISLDTISALQERFILFIQKNAALLSCDSLCDPFLLKKLAGPEFSTYLASFCAQQGANEGQPISETVFLKNDLFLLPQKGGSVSYVLNNLLGAKLYFMEMQPGSPDEFLENLCDAFRNVDPHSLLSQNTFLAETNAHSFILNTKRSLILWCGLPDYDAFAHAHFYYFANNLLDSQIPADQFTLLVERLPARHASIKESLLHFFNKNSNVTFRELRAHLLNITQNKRKYKKFIDTFFYTISLTKNDLSTLLGFLKIELSDENLIYLTNELAKEFSKGALPFLFARLLLKELARFANRVIDPIEIEAFICFIKHLPIPIDCGDLNYHDPQGRLHYRLIIRFNFGSQTLSFFERYKSREKEADPKDYTHLRIFYPKNK